MKIVNNAGIADEGLRLAVGGRTTRARMLDQSNSRRLQQP